MKINKIKLYAFLFAGLTFTACTKDEVTGESNFSPNANVALQVDTTAFGMNPTTTDENDATFEYTLNLSGPQNADVLVPVTLIGGDATEGEDFTFENLIVIPAGVTSKVGSFTVLADELPEGTETFTLKIGTDVGIPNVNTASPTEVTCTIGNFSDTALQVACAWDKEIDVAGTTYNFDLYDFDFYIVDASFTFPGVGGWGGATSANPESFILDGLADGTYYIFAQKYDAPHDFGSLTIPTRVTFSKVGAISPITVEQEASYQWISWQSSSAFPSTSNTKFVTYFEVLGGVYTIYDPSGNIVAQG